MTVPRGENRYGLDVSYVKMNLKLLLRDIENYTPDEMARELQRLSGAVQPAPTDEQIAISKADAQLIVDLCSECSEWMHDDQVEMMGRLIAALQGEKSE